MHLNANVVAWFSVFWSTFHDFLYLAIYWLLQRIGFITLLVRLAPWLVRKPRPLTVRELQDQVTEAHTLIHELEQRVQVLQGGSPNASRE